MYRNPSIHFALHFQQSIYPVIKTIMNQTPCIPAMAIRAKPDLKSLFMQSLNEISGLQVRLLNVIGLF